MNTKSAVDIPGNSRLHVALTVSHLEQLTHFSFAPDFPTKCSPPRPKLGKS